MNEIKTIIEEAFERRADITPRNAEAQRKNRACLSRSKMRRLKPRCRDSTAVFITGSITKTG